MAVFLLKATSSLKPQMFSLNTRKEYSFPMTRSDAVQLGRRLCSYTVNQPWPERGGEGEKYVYREVEKKGVDMWIYRGRCLRTEDEGREGREGEVRWIHSKERESYREMRKDRGESWRPGSSCQPSGWCSRWYQCCLCLWGASTPEQHWRPTHLLPSHL
jgi:hypothetical protein